MALFKTKFRALTQLGYSNIQAEKESFISTLLSPWLLEPVKADYGLASAVALCTLNIPLGTIFDLDCEEENACKGRDSQLDHYMALHDEEALRVPCKTLAALRNDVKKGVKENFPHPMQTEEKSSCSGLALRSQQIFKYDFFPSNFFSRHKHF